MLSEDEAVTVGKVKSIFPNNVEEIYVLGSVMRLHLSKLGYCEPLDHQPRDIDILVQVKDIHRAIEQYRGWNPDPQLHLGFNDKLNLEDVRYLKIYPNVEVNYQDREKDKIASMKVVLHFLKDLLSRNPCTRIRQIWVLRESIRRAVKNLRYPFFDL